MMDIRQSLDRFNQKVRQLKEEGMDRYFLSESLQVPKPGGETLRIPIRRLEIPRLRYGVSETTGVAQGDGDVGDTISPGGSKPNRSGRGQQGSGQHGSGKRHQGTVGRASEGHGDQAGEHDYVELSKEDAADILGTQLKLPNLLEKFGGDVGATKRSRYSSIERVGPKALRSFRRTYQQGLKRAIASGSYDPLNPIITPRRQDERFRSPIEKIVPDSKAAIIYLLDYSGSMSRVLDFLQNVGWWAEAWIRKHYQHIEHRYIQYDASAREVPAGDFYSVKAGGGTDMKAGLEMVKNVAKRDFPKHEYNLYVIHFTDGDCWTLNFSRQDVAFLKGMEDTYPGREEISAPSEDSNPLIHYVIPRCNAFFVCEAGAYYEDGKFYYGGSIFTGNYSHLLQKMVRARPALEDKLRWVSWKEDEIKAVRGMRLRETLEHWLG